MEKRKLIVGIPAKNDAASLEWTLESFFSSTISYNEVVVALSPSEDHTKEVCQDYEVKILEQDYKTPLEAYNKLFAYAKSKKADLFITQTDVGFPELYKRDWLKIMRELAQNPVVGAVTCINGGGISGSDYIEGFHWLGGWCTYYPYRTLKKIGGFDEKFPNGYGVDIDHSYRIYKSGLKVLPINYWVDHHMMNSREHDNSPKAEKMKQESSKYFKKKHELD